MNLLIIGAGGHGFVIKEIAEDLQLYDRIDFVDDANPIAVGKLSDLEALRKNYDSAFISIGNNKLRQELMDRLTANAYKIPSLVHPTAYVSRSAKIGQGTVVEPYATVNANTRIGDGCIISVGAIVDHNVVIEDFVHINAGAIVKAGSKIEHGEKVDAGKVVDTRGELK